MSDTVFRRHYPHTLTVDVDPTTGEVQSLDLLITRMGVSQASAFTQAWERQTSPASARLIARKPDGDEQERVLFGQREVFKVDDDVIRQRRLDEMTEEARAAFTQLEADEAADEHTFLEHTVCEYLHVAPGPRVVVEPEDGSAAFEVKTGADLVRMARTFGARQRGLLRQLVLAVYCENTLGPVEKKLWRSLSASKGSSSTPEPAAPGARPAAIAEPVRRAGSAATAAATDDREPIRSGATTG